MRPPLQLLINLIVEDEEYSRSTLRNIVDEGILQ